MHDGHLIILELFAGAGSATKATKIYAPTVGKNIKAMLIDFVKRDEAVEQHDNLRTLLEDKDIHYFQMDLSQLERLDVPNLLNHFIGCSLSEVDVFHVSFDCSTYSVAGRAAKIHRTVDGSAVTQEAVHQSKMLHTIFKLAYWLTEINSQCLITFESPARGSFRSQPEVQQALRKPNWWLLTGDYCANASESFDGKVHGNSTNRQGGLWPQKPTVILTYGVDWHFKLKACDASQCRMTIPGKNQHVLVICNNEGMVKGQRLVDQHSKAYIPLGLYISILEAHAEWIQGRDGYSAWCLKCGDGGSDLLMCDTQCHRVQHRSCPKICSEDESKWFCDLCCIQKSVQK